MSEHSTSERDSNQSGSPDSSPSRLVASAFGLHIAVDTDPALLLDVVPWLPDGWAAPASSTTIDRTYTLGVDRPAEEPGLLTYAFAVNGEHRYRSPSLALFSDYFENDLHHYIATYTRQGYVFVHAGVAVWSGRAIVIPGRSYAGKSTLTRALLEADATYYSDDYAIIDDLGLVHPFHGTSACATRAPSPAASDPREQGWPVGYGSVPIGIVAALRYDAGQGWNATEVSKGAGVLALLANTVAARERPVDALGVMAKAVESAVIVEGTRGEAEEAADRLLSMLSKPQS